MAFIDKTWSAGEALTATGFNTNFRDNFRYLKGLDGTVEIEDNLAIQRSTQPRLTLSATSDGTLVEFRLPSDNQCVLEHDPASGSATIDIIPNATGANEARVRILRSTNTVGQASFDVCRANNTTALNARLSAKNEDSFVCAESGNFAIGASAVTGTYKCDILGDARVSSDLLVGGVLTVNGTSVLGTSARIGSALFLNATSGTRTELIHATANQTTLTHTSTSGNALVDISALPLQAGQSAGVRFFRQTNTSGDVNLDVHIGNNTNVVNCRLSGNGDSFLANNGGRVIIGASSGGTGKLYVVGNIQSTSSFVGGGLSITGNGNVNGTFYSNTAIGVGIASPAEPLHVSNGRARFDDRVYFHSGAANDYITAVVDGLFCSGNFDCTALRTGTGPDMRFLSIGSSAAFTQSHRLQVSINGTSYYIPLDQL